MKKMIVVMIRIILLVLIVGFFLPCFTVSCASQSEDVSALTECFGYQNYYGQQVVDAHPGLLFLFFYPVGIVHTVIYQKAKRYGIALQCDYIVYNRPYCL